MKVKIIQSFGVSGGPALQPGDILDPPTEVALEWITQGLAKPVGNIAEAPVLAVGEETSLPVIPRRKRNR